MEPANDTFSVLASIYRETNVADLTICLDSLKEQTTQASEIVIVEDGPVDPMVRVCLSRFKDMLPIKTLPFKKNRGLGYSLRDGLVFCSHELVARVDTDDYSVPNRFTEQQNFLRLNPEIDVVGGQMIETWQTGPSARALMRTVPLSTHNVRVTAVKQNPMNHPTVMFRKTAVIDAGNYQHCPFFEDYFLWARMLKQDRRLANLPEVLVTTNTNADFFRRRGGFQYFQYERELARKLATIGFFTYPQSVRFLLTRFSFRLVPFNVRAQLYTHLLRRKINLQK